MVAEIKGERVRAAEIGEAVSFFNYRDLEVGQVLDFLVVNGWTVELKGKPESLRASVILLDRERMSRRSFGRRIVFKQVAPDFRNRAFDSNIGATIDYVEEISKRSRSGFSRTELTRSRGTSIQEMSLVSGMSIDWCPTGRELVLTTEQSDRATFPLTY